MNLQKVINRDFVLKVITWLCRLIVGGTFMFSGFVKGIDPWGTLYKFEDYLSALGLQLWPNLILTGVFGLCIAEFLCGFFILTGSFRRSSPIFATLFMVVMLPLTLWIAIKDPVADCGCFGDAFIISNWATFYKNVVLSALIIWLLIYNRKCGCLITPYIQWIGFLASGLYLGCIALYGYFVQPMIDFRAYPVGEKLISDSDDDSETEYEFIYERDGVRKAFGEDDVIPDESEGWVFVDRIEKGSKNALSNRDHNKDIRIWNSVGEDSTDSIAGINSGKRLLITMPVLRDITPAVSWKLNTLSEYSRRCGIEMVGIVNGNSSEIEYFKDLCMPDYPIYTADDTSIKALVRGNPGVVYTEDGIIKWKISLRAIDAEELEVDDNLPNPESLTRDSKKILNNLTGLYLAIISVLILFSIVKKVWLRS